MVSIAGGIFSTLYIKDIVAIFLGITTGHKTVALLRIYIIDFSSFTLEIIADAIGLIRRTCIRENRLSDNSACAIGTTKSVYHATVYIHRDDIGLQLYLLIINLTCAIKIGTATTRPHE